MRTVKFYSHCKFQLNNTVLSTCKLVTNLHIRPSGFIYLSCTWKAYFFFQLLPISPTISPCPHPTSTLAPGNNFWFYVSVRFFWLETWVRSLGWEDPLVKGKATHSSILENSMDNVVHGISKSWTQLSNFHSLTHWFFKLWKRNTQIYLEKKIFFVQISHSMNEQLN